jgi:predicted metalloprotease with PDZ domain
VDENAASNNPSLGVGFAATGKKTVTIVVRNGAAWNDGINTGDEITSIDGNTVIDTAVLFKDKKPGDKITVNLTRDGLPLTLPVTLLRNTHVKYAIETLPNPSPQQLKVRNKWLKL